MRFSIFLVTAILIVGSAKRVLGEVKISIGTPMAPPTWALLERQLIESQTEACRLFFERYFDERGYLQCVERWGANDGPDDAIESLRDWPTLHALGAPDVILGMYKKAWEGHLLQYTEAKTKEVEFARDGMYYKEFPVMMDWLHNDEGLSVFNLQGLSDPNDLRFRQRVRRFAGFYMNEDPGAANYDPKHRIIRSLFNGSRGPLLRKATALDWAGDPIEIENRFKPHHGEANYQQMLEHFQNYNDIVGDHPVNTLATSLAANAYMLENEEKYKRWVLEYMDAWLERMEANDGIIPTNVGLDGTIGGAAGGKWYGGVYGWGFTVRIPGSTSLAHRNRHHYGIVGFSNAFLLTGDPKYLLPWRKQIDKINAQAKVINGQKMYPKMYGDQGWYHFTQEKYDHGALELYYFLMDSQDLQRIPQVDWIDYLHGKNPNYPEESLRADLDRIRRKVEAIRVDTTTPDTRLCDDPLPYNPATVGRLFQLMLGGLHHIAHTSEFKMGPHEGMKDYLETIRRNRKRTGFRGSLIHSRVRYFDPARRRAGIPEDVAALVDKLTADETTLTLVNINQVEPRTVIVQGGAYGEHQCVGVSVNGEEVPVNGPFFTVRLAPGGGGRMTIKMKRYANQPTLKQPWDRP
jgi:hypothetical protein